MFAFTSKIIIISLVKKILGDPGTVSLIKTKKGTAAKIFRDGRESPWDATRDKAV